MSGNRPGLVTTYRLLADRFPFAIYYELKDDIATVIAVLDCRQNPASITERVG